MDAQGGSGPSAVPLALGQGLPDALGLDLLEENAAFEPWRSACELLQKQLAAND